MPSRIEWTDETWNPVTGCTKVSEGCLHCYAERMAKRLAGRFGYPADNPFQVTLHPDRLDQPYKWRKSRMVFVCSMGDLFHEDVMMEDIRRIFWIMQRAKQHTFQVLTKRPRRMWKLLTSPFMDLDLCLPLPNVWLGVTAENQEMADERIPILLDTPAVVRFVSMEPMLERIDIDEYLPWCNRCVLPEGEAPCNFCSANPNEHSFLDWAIAGGESGPGARPHPALVDVRNLKDQCVASGTPFFLKQMWGEKMPHLDGRQWAEFPTIH